MVVAGALKPDYDLMGEGTTIKTSHVQQLYDHWAAITGPVVPSWIAKWVTKIKKAINGGLVDTNIGRGGDIPDCFRKLRQIRAADQENTLSNLLGPIYHMYMKVLIAQEMDNLKLACTSPKHPSHESITAAIQQIKQSRQRDMRTSYVNMVPQTYIEKETGFLLGSKGYSDAHKALQADLNLGRPLLQYTQAFGSGILLPIACAYDPASRNTSGWRNK